VGMSSASLCMYRTIQDICLDVYSRAGESVPGPTGTN
jgi:hypothetical protein